MKVKIIDSLGIWKQFPSQADTVKFLEVNESSIRRAIKKGFTCRGYKVYIDEDMVSNPVTEMTPAPIKQVNGIPSGRHLCISDLHIPYVNQTLMLKITKMLQ